MSVNMDQYETKLDAKSIKRRPHQTIDDAEYLTAVDESGTRLSLNEKTELGGKQYNNLIINSAPLVISDNVDAYEEICSLVEETQVWVQLSDSKGLWQRLDTSVDHEVDDPSEVLDNIAEEADDVWVELVVARSTNNVEASDAVNKFELVSDLYEEASEIAGVQTTDPNKGQN